MISLIDHIEKNRLFSGNVFEIFDKQRNCEENIYDLWSVKCLLMT